MHQLLVFGSAVGAGMINSVTGGGTLLSFPTLIWLGVPSIPPMPTSTVALWPGSLCSVWGFDRLVLLIFFATCLLAAQEAIQRRSDLSAIHTCARSPWLSAAALGAIGFAIYGPQFLVGVFAADLASRKAAATAIGLTGIFGYAGSFLATVVTGRLVDKLGWGAAFTGWFIAAIVGALFTLPLFSKNPRT